MIPGLVVAALSSGAGKTSVTLGLLAALGARGLRVAAFKSGPDYIDPAFHAVATGRSAFNLDAWAMTPARIDNLVSVAAPSDIAVLEGAMGLFDGATEPGLGGSGATADLAAMLGWPVLLVIDVRAQAQSAGAIALGAARFRDDITIAGVILNRVASPLHEKLAREGVEKAGFRVFGCLPETSAIALPERHLGLVQAEENPALPALLAVLAERIESHADLDAIVAAAHPARLSRANAAPLPPPGMRIALARDAAFSFVYPHLVAAWRAAGATILPFSPLADAGPDPSADVVWLPGGYPELHAGRLAAAARFRHAMMEAARNVPIHGECGGYMALGAGLIDANGVRYPMLGLLGLETSFAKRRMHLGYRIATLDAPIPGFATGARLSGHEFHFATIVDQPDVPLARITDTAGVPVVETGSRRGRVSGSFFHLIDRYS